MKFWLSVLLLPWPILIGSGYTADNRHVPIAWNIEDGVKKVDINCYGVIPSFVGGALSYWYL